MGLIPCGFSHREVKIYTEIMQLKRVNPAELDLKEEKVVKVNRVAKVVKGGRKFSFNALVVIGDGKGHVGIGMGKANEVTDAISKGKEKAKKNIVKIPLTSNTIPHHVMGKFSAARVILKPASPGTGIIAGGPVRAVMEQLGVKDILSKSLGSSNAQNVVKATMTALLKLKDAGLIARKKGISIREIWE